MPFTLYFHPPGATQPILLSPNGTRHLLRRCQQCFDGKCEEVHAKNETILDSLGVSRRHFEIWASDEREACYVRDLKSTNGVYINGIRIPTMKAHEYHPGDLLTLQTTPDEPPSYSFKLSQCSNDNDNNNKRPLSVSPAACPTPSSFSSSFSSSTSSHKRRRMSPSPDDNILQKKLEESQRQIRELQQKLGMSCKSSLSCPLLFFSFFFF
jgi:hypothetical protein